MFLKRGNSILFERMILAHIVPGPQTDLISNKQMPILVSMMELLRHHTVPGAGRLASEASRKMSIKNEAPNGSLASDRSAITTIGPE